LRKTISPREAAVAALHAYRRNGTSAEAALDREIKRLGPDSRDAALASKLTFGVLQNRALLDFYLGQCSHAPVEKAEPQILDILRVAAYQILFFTRIPPRAAVDEAVGLTKQKTPRAAGYVNAVLRRLTESVGANCVRPPLSEPPDLATKYSHPQWLVGRFTDLLGEAGAEALLAANNAEVPIYAQINTRKAPTVHIEGAEPHPWLPDCLILTGQGDVSKLEPFIKGELYVQDPAARLAVFAANPQPDTRFLDVCAAPGGKSFAAAIQMGNKGAILASDIHEKKLSQIRAGATRLGIDIIQTRPGDARHCDPAEIGLFDTVFVDAPCSGLGIIRKKPEIRYKTPEEIRGLPEIQLAILEGAARCVAPGGTLVYATCTVLPEENSGVVAAFLAQNGDFTLEGFTLPGEIGAVPGGQITLYPHLHGTDGFFISKLRRTP